MGIPVGYEAWVSRSAKITVKYRCSACGHEDTALVAGMGSGVGGGRGYGRDAASGLANVAASEQIEQDAKRIATAIRCPKCGAGGRTPATLEHPRLVKVKRETTVIFVLLAVFFTTPLLLSLLALNILALLFNVALFGAIGWWARTRRDKAIAGRTAFVDAALADAALWSVAPERFTPQ